MPEAFPLFIIGFIILAIVVRLLAGSFDGGRVKDYIENTLDGELIDQSWDPLGPGWFGEKNDRIYEIVYRDRDGAVHRAHVKTSMLSGVYLTQDRIIEHARTPVIKRREVSVAQAKMELEDEKVRLEARLREIEAEQRKSTDRV
ncbi:hypothetical protein [Coraliomargarita parva]|uniref:hypothetical protein n=1 Tax=Coraliomargarita parva TaxID=3014050 RepID=UPI0022B301BC|nr:hypothetical protein [Coraliomargarita parva]